MIRTIDPERAFSVAVTADSVAFEAVEPVDDPVLTMPAESLIRLVYGRLDPDHTPAEVSGDPSALDQLREVFPGL